MDTLEDEIPERKDASRAFLIRNKGEVGIYLDVIDAKAINPKEFGLEHAFMMDVKEKMQERLIEINLVNIKGALEHRGLFCGVILEEVRKGMVLVVTFDNMEALEDLWKLFEKDKLSPLFQELMVTKETLKHCNVSRMTLRAKMWEDEYVKCKEEIGSRGTERLSLKSFKHDARLLKEIREYQKTLGDHTMVLRDLEHDFDRNTDNFMIAARRILPENDTIVHSLRDFRKSVRVAKGIKKTGFEIIDKYFETLDKIETIFIDVERNVCYRLSQVHGVCESAEQTALKEAIKTKQKEVIESLKPDHNLQKVRFTDWEIKVEPRDKMLFFGLVSLVPIGLEALIDIDHYIDDYITKFPDQL